MVQKPENILQQIKNTRILKQRNIHDCATLLNISKDQYLKFERGEAYLTLPEIELLAIFFGVPVQSFFQMDTFENDDLSLLNEGVLPKFLNLRHKMIQSKYIIERNKKGETIEGIHVATHIALETLENYESGKTPIPLNHLLKICDCLELPEETFLDGYLGIKNHSSFSEHVDWQPEFSDAGEIADKNTENPYVLLINALTRMPKDEQARFVKFLLNELKTL